MTSTASSSYAPAEQLDPHGQVRRSGSRASARLRKRRAALALGGVVPATHSDHDVLLVRAHLAPPIFGGGSRTIRGHSTQHCSISATTPRAATRAGSPRRRPRNEVRSPRAPAVPSLQASPTGPTPRLDPAPPAPTTSATWVIPCDVGTSLGSGGPRPRDPLSTEAISRGREGAGPATALRRRLRRLTGLAHTLARKGCKAAPRHGTAAVFKTGAGVQPTPR